MGRTVKIFDTTLRDGEQSPGCSMNLNEKIEVAKQLEALKVDIIEAGFAAASPGDAAAIAAIADTVRGATICSLARCREQDIEAAWNSIRRAESARIHTFLATSPVHMEYKLKMTPEQVLESVAHNVAFAKKFCSDIEFSAEDATRSDLDFLCRVVETAIKAGATTINIPDTVGYMIPLRLLPMALMLAVRAGMDKTDALRAVTSVPAKIAGMQDRIGSLKTGLDADCVLWSGDPLDIATQVQAVFVNGTPEYRRTK